MKHQIIIIQSAKNESILKVRNYMGHDVLQPIDQDFRSHLVNHITKANRPVVRKSLRRLTFWNQSDKRLVRFMEQEEAHCGRPYV